MESTGSSTGLESTTSGPNSVSSVESSVPTSALGVSSTTTQSTTVVTSTTSTSVPVVTSSTVASTSSTLPPVDLSVLSMSDSQRSCVSGRLPEGTDLAAAPADEADEAVSACVWLEAAGVSLAQSLRERYGAEISEAQVQCVVLGYAALTSDERSTLFEAALSPGSASVDDAAGLGREIFEGCDVTPKHP